MLNIIILFIFGFVLSSFAVLPILICIFFGIPFTRKLNKQELLIPGNPVTRRYMFSIILLAIFYLATLLLVISFADESPKNTFLAATISVIIISVNKLSNKPDNVIDYIKTQHRYFAVSPDEVAKSLINN